MSPDMLQQHNTRMVAVWNSSHGYHAVYVNKIEKQQGKPGYLLHCLNSWGDANNPNPVIENKDIVSLHYVSLFMENYIVLSSTGSVAEHQGSSSLGIYKEKGVYNGSKYYEQVHTLNTTQKGQFVYRNKNGSWEISDTLGLGAAFIQNLNTTSTLPMGGWQNYVGDHKWQDDPHFRVSSVLPSPCGDITISASGEAASKQASCLGVYQPTGIV